MFPVTAGTPVPLPAPPAPGPPQAAATPPPGATGRGRPAPLLTEQRGRRQQPPRALGASHGGGRGQGEAAPAGARRRDEGSGSSGGGGRWQRTALGRVATAPVGHMTSDVTRPAWEPSRDPGAQRGRRPGERGGRDRSRAGGGAGPGVGLRCRPLAGAGERACAGYACVFAQLPVRTCLCVSVGGSLSRGWVVVARREARGAGPSLGAGVRVAPCVPHARDCGAAGAYSARVTACRGVSVASLSRAAGGQPQLLAPAVTREPRAFDWV